MSADRIPSFSVAELNTAIGNLLERGFAPRFLVEATVSRPQLKKGHLWLTLTDGEASISAVAWASQLRQLRYRPEDGDGVTVVGKLNFWAARASLNVQVLDIRPSLSTVLRQFELVRRRLEEAGLLDITRRRPLPRQPRTLAVLTSVPSSALADMLRTASERWPMTRLLVVPIPVQGSVAARIREVLGRLAEEASALGLDALVLARGGGSREDLAVFDDEDLCRDLAAFPVPVVTGLGHEDDLTVADLVADHRAATPTAAIVALLPDRHVALRELQQQRQRLRELRSRWLERQHQRLLDRRQALALLTPQRRLQQLRQQLEQRRALLRALSPQRWLKQGLALVSNGQGMTIDGVKGVRKKDTLTLSFHDGSIETVVTQVRPQNSSSTP
ncbi:exodeoxyribonuclease VII, large subunit [Synechococcus sp. WH 8103]|uniref:Exodeoxyribonuclease 7 large subunit n=1 Tax=Parasynechococcus marenigrum (strain WH8102) TaxID=84588 RepID=EX7L_PARMW|nr:exodeoxyribonuclease VII large subunit [Parasynechococcus marenigrum]Q7U490.1 RecName: Full=Exodeoxyribonuclease 7 large subunit; AltName: Full=Exodeoxyribonuclease VII large subunit; Short=Exonuclease VII large subunit [Parasynechococcus marenigrum WH 8102]QNI52203.1 exodeoxyribonuclease VII/ large subunit [Synechococcus sp. RS9915]CAE08696.1 possible exodeoxyribonuclease VII large subunit [Parasynechococcus marenigrum WH 8102]CRY93190.1 exodeoxyribonuclease VII, large subunit [Synechococcu